MVDHMYIFNASKSTEYVRHFGFSHTYDTKTGERCHDKLVHNITILTLSHGCN